MALQHITRYNFMAGKLKGFSAGGAIRWEDAYAAGYPIITDTRGVIQPDLRNAYFASPQTSL